MKSRFLLLVVLPGLAGIAHAADDVMVVGSLDFAYKDMTLEAAGGGGGQKFNTSITTINPGIAFGYKRAYVNVNFDKSIDSGITTQIEQNLPSQLTMSRNDTVVAFGYRVHDSINLFTGWISGNIGANLLGQRQINPGPPLITAFYTQEITYTEKGPFAGISFSRSFGEKGSASLSIAYAKLDGEMTQTRYIGASSDGLTPPSTIREIGNADVNGLSYSLSWTGPLTGSMNYRLGFKATRYEGTASGSGASSINEFYNSFFLGLSNTF